LGTRREVPHVEPAIRTNYRNDATVSTDCAVYPDWRMDDPFESRRRIERPDKRIPRLGCVA
jgi:hypothetical protein